MDVEDPPEVVVLHNQVATQQQKLDAQKGNIAALQEMVNAMRATFVPQGLQLDPHGKVPPRQPVGCHLCTQLECHLLTQQVCLPSTPLSWCKICQLVCHLHT